MGISGIFKIVGIGLMAAGGIITAVCVANSRKDRGDEELEPTVTDMDEIVAENFTTEDKTKEEPVD